MLVIKSGECEMRVIVRLQSLADSEYDIKYYHKLQGFIYSLLKDTPYYILHDKGGYKFLCFSNIFPPKNTKKDDSRSLIISSPDTVLVKLLKEKMLERGNACVGELVFKIEEVSILEPKIQKNCNLITGTPIIIRIQKWNYEKYGIKPPKDYEYVFWRKNYSFEAFIRQLEANLFKKYNEYHETEIKEFRIFEQFLFKKQVCNHIIINGKEEKVFGSIWEFIFNYLDNEQRKILQFGLDCGFGEMNSMGFGFMNVVR